MQFQAFYKIIKEIRPIFTLTDLKVVFSNQPVSSRQLSRWQVAGHILKLKNGVYMLKDYTDLVHPFLMGNLLYQPSYISMESALYEYGFIPDVTQSITSVSAKKTWSTSALGHNFVYKKIKKDCYIGYGAKKYLGYDALMAEPEKALVDFFYFNKSRVKNENHINELRFNYESIKQKVNKEKLCHYAELCGSKLLNDIIKKLIAKF